MKYLFASDIHGSAYYCKKVLDVYKNSGAQRLILLGDILYHGPRNELPKDYNPKEVFAMLNELKDEIYAIRGNCDSEVDQMVLEFPMMADYALLALNGKTFYATHGHVFHEDNLPPLQAGDILIHGHTHLPVAEKKGEIYILNPGSTSLPKEGNPNSYAVLEENVFKILTFEGEVLKEITL
ncbi:phosphodiesterase [Clostridium sp. MCC353]|uniref:phosphodiesterase n=1 Tax=Clostridium sp. MCC353 TaxID=2592646 RepID=UPI001C011490|nr:phosphodiesterase [Clostridium sp. MCC353]MBT9775870.1 phosphodiesterase [Clostridium sp. MCC353]